MNLTVIAVWLKCSNFSITTSRDNIDLTCLSEHYRKRYESGLIQGQGRLSCYWAYEELCKHGDVNDVEFAEYSGAGLHSCCAGCRFPWPLLPALRRAHRLCVYEAECETCLISNVAIAVQPGQLITAEIDFITSGPIMLRHGQPAEFLLQEPLGLDEMFLLEQDGSSKLELENNDG